MARTPPSRRARQPATLAEKALYTRALRNFVTEDDSPQFLDFVKYDAVALQGKPGGPSPLELWPHTIRLALSFIKHRFVVVPKARQIGFSWVIMAYAVWLCMTHPSALVITFSRNERDAWDLMGKAPFIHSNLPDAMKDGHDTIIENLGQMVFENGSEIVAYPSTKDAGRGRTASLVVCDEHDFHPYASDNQSAVRPSIAAGGKMFLGSTMNKSQTMTVFKETVRNAPDNGYHVEFVGWKERPGRDQAWYDQEKAAITVEELAIMSPEQRMAQEYPATLEEALSPAGSSLVFDQDVLNHMWENDVEEPLLRTRNTRVFRKYSARNGPYAIGTDSSHGTGGDYAASVCLDLSNGQVVANIISNLLEPAQLAEETMAMAAMYNDPLWCIELNDWGILVQKAAEEAGYKRFYDQNFDKRHSEPQYGYKTSRGNRNILLGTLVDEIRTNALHIFDRDGLSQFFGIVYNREKGRLEALGGKHDDYPFAVALAVEGGKQVSKRRIAGPARNQRHRPRARWAV